MILDIVYILIGFVLLVKGGDILVDGSVALARRARLSPMVIGLTVMGFGTSAPELLVSAQAALMGSSGIALGNVAGSNIANVALILGVTSLVAPLPAGRRALRIDMPFMLLSMAVLVGIAATGTIGRLAGVAMVVLLVAFVWWEVVVSRRSNKRQSAAETTEGTTAGVMPLGRALLLVVASLAAMIVGSKLLVAGASDASMQLGQALGVPASQMERIIGLTVVALGTSLPELFASVISARRGEADMAVGNIIGSVTFNILCVVGVASAIRPIVGTWDAFWVDYAVMCLLGLLLWFFLRTRHLLERWEGAVLLTTYVAYMLWLGVAA